MKSLRDVRMTLKVFQIGSLVALPMALIAVMAANAPGPQLLLVAIASALWSVLLTSALGLVAVACTEAIVERGR